MAQKEKEYLVAFKLYIEHYDPRYRYPKWIKAGSKKDAVTKYEAMIKPDPTLGACIIIDERPVKQDEHSKNINEIYRKGNLKLLEIMISQLNRRIDPANPNHTPRPFIIDMEEINEKLCPTSRLAYMLSAGYGQEMLPYNGYIYSDEFFEYVNEYINARYKFGFYANGLYDDYALMKIRGDLQSMYNYYNKYGILPWENKKLEDHICGTSEVLNVSDFQAVVNREETNEDKTLVIKINKQRTDKKEDDSMKESKESIDMITYVPQFDIIRADISINFPYILEIDNATTGVSEKHVIVITNIMENCIYCNQWDNVNDDPHSGIVLSPFDFHERNAKLYKITGEDLK